VPAKVAISVSPDFIFHVRQIYEMALEEIKSGRVVRYEINGYTRHGLPAYIMAVASVEAFVNEVFLSEFSRITLKNSPLMNLPVDWIEKLELGAKLILIPELIFRRSFPRDAQPYQDMVLLIRIRNDLVHYKMGSTPPKYIKPLEERGIILPSPGAEQGIDADYAWPSKLSCSEGIRWAHNTACETVQALVDFAPQDSREKLPYVKLITNFEPISRSYAIDWFKSHGIELNVTQ
jgi:hypothetical protein